MKSELPSKKDWTQMEDAGLNSVMQKCAEHWEHVCLALVQFFDAFFLYFTSIHPGCLQLRKYISGLSILLLRI